jgi:diphthamide biosynthesis methyltransferase
MSNPLIQIDDEVREMTADEAADYQIMIDADTAREAEAQAKADAKAAVLDRLGITAEEAALLLA